MGKKFGLTNKPVVIGSDDRRLSILSEESKQRLKDAINRQQYKKETKAVDISEYLPGQYIQKQVPISILEAAPDEWNFFTKPSKEKIIALAESIYYNGLLQPIVVRELTADGTRLQVLAGHTRTEAYRALQDVFGNYDTITALVFPYGVLTDTQAEDIVCDTNFMQRGTLSTMETAKCIALKARRIKESGIRYGDGSVASRISEYYHIRRAMVFRWQRIANLIPELAQLSEQRQLTAFNMYKLAGFSPEEQRKIYRRAADYISNNTLRYINAKHKLEDIVRIIKNDKAPDIPIHYSVPAESLNGKSPILILVDNKEYLDILKKLQQIKSIQVYN